RDEDEVDVIPRQRKRSRWRGPAHRNLSHVSHRNDDRKLVAGREQCVSTLRWVSRRKLPRRTPGQRDVGHVDSDELHWYRARIANVHFNIADASAGSRARDLVVSGATPAIRSVLRCPIHNIPSNYDRTVLVEVEAADYIIDYLTKIGAFNL